MKTVFFLVNAFQKDGSGLPVYSEGVIKAFAHRQDVLFLNIVSKQDAGKEGQATVREFPGGAKIINFRCDRIYNTQDYSQSFIELLNKLFVEKYFGEIGTYIVPDGAFENYLQHIALPSYMKKIVFIHLFYRGYMEALLDSKKTLYPTDYIKTALNGEILESVAREQRAFETADEIWCNSHFTYKEVKKYLPFFYTKESVKVKAFPLQGFAKGLTPHEPTGNYLNAAYFGRLTAQKGIGYLVKDTEGNKEFYRQSPLFIYGGSLDSRNSQELAIHQWKTHTMVVFPALLKPMLYEQLKQFDVCVFPSVYEPYGFALSEAMALGKICIVNKRESGLTEQVADKVNGFHLDFARESLADFLQNELPTYDLPSIQKKAIIYQNNPKINHFQEVEQELFSEYNQNTNTYNYADFASMGGM